jgi:hypothetical protein
MTRSFQPDIDPKRDAGVGLTRLFALAANNNPIS